MMPERKDMSVGAGWLIETKFSAAARGRRQIERDRILDGSPAPIIA